MIQGFGGSKKLLEPSFLTSFEISVSLVKFSPLTSISYTERVE